MKRSVRFLPEALGDLLETRHWYASRERGGADRARSGLISLVHGKVRRLVVRQFPYAVYFQEVGDEILVLAVHGRQDPRRWKGRSMT